MTEERILYIDNRERSGLEALVIKYCEKKKLKFEMRQTIITDYSLKQTKGVEG